VVWLMGEKVLCMADCRPVKRIRVPQESWHVKIREMAKEGGFRSIDVSEVERIYKSVVGSIPGDHFPEGTLCFACGMYEHIVVMQGFCLCVIAGNMDVCLKRLDDMRRIMSRALDVDFILENYEIMFPKPSFLPFFINVLIYPFLTGILTSCVYSFIPIEKMYLLIISLAITVLVMFVEWMRR